MFVTKYQESSLTKGLGELNQPNWRLLEEEVSLPVAVLYQSRIENNLNWMQKFANAYGVKLAPHGKTTMTPALFRQQQAAGAWGITLATAPQVVAAAAHGCKRIIMANQLVGKQNMRLIASVLNDPDAEFYCLVDSIAQVQQLAAFFAETGLTLNVLIEIGVNGGRCGCRTPEQVDAVVHEISLHSFIALAGIEVYEGVIHGDNAQAQIHDFLTGVITICNNLITQNAFDTRQVILTGAGSAWYDVVAATFAEATLHPSIIPVIRPGCYLIHDTGIYLEAQNEVMARNTVACDLGGDLQSALEVWAYVQSIPEPGHVIIGMGKRDVAFDAGLPIPALHYRPAQPTTESHQQNLPTAAPNDWQVTAVMDQHAFLSCPIDSDIAVGDMIAFSSSHPCLTFDKWKHIAVINDEYHVTQVLNTYF
ncbi:amino acid deaminase [Motilimonas cestriensis]|uniref:amino acid deaminase n=1 Tax=Motilimonas cestriensis TaxID=2742685 RepID=UPI003DA2FA1C